MNNAVFRETTRARLAVVGDPVRLKSNFLSLLFLSCFYIHLEDVILQLSVSADWATPAATVVSS